MPRPVYHGLPISPTIIRRLITGLVITLHISLSFSYPLSRLWSHHTAFMLGALSTIHQSTRSSPLTDILHRSQLSGTLVLVLLAPRLSPIYTDYAIVTSLFASSSCYHLIVNSRTPHPPPFYPMFYHTKGACARSPYHRRSLCVSLLPCTGGEEWP